MKRYLSRGLLIVAAIFGVLLTGSPANADDTYHTTMKYNAWVDGTRGWSVDWKVPDTTNGDTESGTLGQWYYGLEVGLYRVPSGWYVYFYGDDDGTEGNTSACETAWGTGGFCNGFGAISVGKRVSFTYEWCDQNGAPNANGEKLCLWADLGDGKGDRFLAVTDRGTSEMYSHIGSFGGRAPVGIPCSSPAKMAGQVVKNQQGSWQRLAGQRAWGFWQDGVYQIQNFKDSYDSWQICGGAGRSNEVNAQQDKQDPPVSQLPKP